MVYWLVDRKFLVTDSFVLLLWTLIITTIEGRRLIDGSDTRYSLWKLIFEGELFSFCVVVVVVIAACWRMLAGIVLLRG